MRLECNYRGVLREFTVKAIQPADSDPRCLAERLEILQLETKTPSLGVPTVYSMSRTTAISFDGTKDVTQENTEEEVTYSSIGGLKDQIEILRDTVEMPLLRPHLFVRFGMKPPRGVLLYGPPGTGKTLLLRAVANETKAHVITISGPSVVSKYQGETESTLRSIFTEARERQPSIIFIDEIDSLAPKRGNDNESSLDVADGRVVATLLTLMDGMEKSGRVVVVAATNRPNSIDPALRRPGRFDQELEIGIPDADARLEILRIQLRRMPHDLTDTYIRSVAAKTHGYVGADLMALCTKAGTLGIKRGIRDNVPEYLMKIDEADVESALFLVQPSAMREVIHSKHTIYLYLRFSSRRQGPNGRISVAKKQ
jgi:AAA family ATPase